MKVILFGGSGMIGQGVLRECLRDDTVQQVLAVGRSPLQQQHAKLHEIVHIDLFDLDPVADQLTGFDACLFCLGVSAAGMSEADYRRVTYDLTLAVARVLVTRNPELTFIYISGTGADPTGASRMMWARVKGETENALRELSPHTYVFRPGFIQPRHGIRSRTRLYNALYTGAAPLLPALRWLAPGTVTDTERLGRAMLAVARTGASSRVLTNRDINAAGQ